MFDNRFTDNHFGDIVRKSKNFIYSYTKVRFFYEKIHYFILFNMEKNNTKYFFK